MTIVFGVLKINLKISKVWRGGNQSIANFFFCQIRPVLILFFMKKIIDIIDSTDAEFKVQFFKLLSFMKSHPGLSSCSDFIVDQGKYCGKPELVCEATVENH